MRDIDSGIPVDRAETLTASPLGRQMLARWVKWKERVCDASPEYHKLAPSWKGSKKGLLDHILVSEWRNLPAGGVKAAFRAAVADAGYWRRRIAQASERELAEALAKESDNFGFSLESEAIWGLTAIAMDELKPVADALVAAPGTGKWWGTTNFADQRFVSWIGSPPLRGADLTRAVSSAKQELRSRNSFPTGSYASIWWSIPPFAEQSWTASGLQGLWSLGLLYFSDAYGPGTNPTDLFARGEAPVLWQVTINDAARAYEVSCAEDWRLLAEQFPCDASRTHGGDWSKWSGVPGPWLLPDWGKVMERYDGVHVSIGGYLSSCGRAVPVRNGHSMLVGWLPGATLWLSDMISNIAEHGKMEY